MIFKALQVWGMGLGSDICNLHDNETNWGPKENSPGMQVTYEEYVEKTQEGN